MNIMEAIQARHAVRSYLKQDIDPAIAAQLQKAIDEYNHESGLSIQLCLNEARAFDSILARYGVFLNVNNYLALVGKKGDKAAQDCGYYGEKLVLFAQQLGLNTCWVGGTYSRRKVLVKKKLGEKLHLVIALGYGENQGKAHSTKSVEQLSTVVGENPDWFKDAMKAVQLAPSAMNQQKFHFTLEQVVEKDAGKEAEVIADGKASNEASRASTKDSYIVKAETANGLYAQVDLGIAKCHFEIAAKCAGALCGLAWNWV